MMVIRNLISYPIILAVLFAGCSSTSELVKKNVAGPSAEYTVIYYIHADAGYLYHEADGRPIRANAKVLETALEVAENARSGEVFIFYQRPERKFLGLFPRKSNQFYHYTNGQKTTQVKYRHPNKEEPFLTTEAQLYTKYGDHATKKYQQLYFLYFGHEIPNDDGKNYHRTLPDIEVNTASFADGIQHFLGKDNQILDLAVLSTCNNGTPTMAAHLMSFTDHLLASPQNLHLSHIDTEQLSLLERDPGISPEQVAHSLADDTFRRLEEQIHTPITLAEYDLESIRAYIEELDGRIISYKDTARIDPYHQNTDCRQFSFFDAEKYTQGVETWFKPARFGRRAGGAPRTHSGWGCKPMLKN